tara:strand:- start:14 stop:271 length:258 start_codon:yes stop_codon:yes gene_type:complete
MSNVEMLAKDTIKAGKAVDAIKPGDILVYHSRIERQNRRRIYFYINIGPNKYYRIPDLADNVYSKLLTSWIVRNLMSGHIKILSA